MKREIHVEIWALDKYEMPQSVEDLKDLVKRTTDALEAMEGRVIRFIEDDDYEGGWSSVKAYYTREETDQETAAREAEERGYAERQEAVERATYERLRAKYK